MDPKSMTHFRHTIRPLLGLTLHRRT
jgi:hypothetical protein